MLAIANEYHLNFTLSDEDIVFIGSIYRGRYPAEEGLLPLKEPAQEDAEKAFTIVKRILTEVQNQLKEQKAETDENGLNSLEIPVVKRSKSPGV